MTNDYRTYIQNALDEAGVPVDKVEERSFPGERWLVVFVPSDTLVVAQTLAGAIERELNAVQRNDEPSFTLVFRATTKESEAEVVTSRRGRLSDFKVDQLIQLLEARSRTSDALPSLRYVDDPRSSLPAVAASRHQLIYGRRGVGKTALLLEAKRLAEKEGDVTVWMNAHTFRSLAVPNAFLHIAGAALVALLKHGGSSQSEPFVRIKEESVNIGDLLAGDVTDDLVGAILPNLNTALRGILRPGLMRLNIYIDDFYYFPKAAQPLLLDHISAMLSDCNGWLKVASIERLTKPFEPSSKVGLEIPHDASKIDLDVTLEDPQATQTFLERVLSNYTTTVGLGKPSTIAKSQALGRLVLASGGVPRDYLNLFASSIVVAREKRAQARQVGREDVAVAAGRSATSKKRDLEQDVTSETANSLLSALATLSTQVKGSTFTYFRVDLAQESDERYGILGQLVDLRFVHLIQDALSDQHKKDTKYAAYLLDLSEYTDVRLKRNLRVLDLEDGKWSWRLAGTAGTEKRLTRTQLRDELRLAPLVDIAELA